MLMPFLPSSVTDALHAKREHMRASALRSMFPEAYGDPGSQQAEMLNAALEQEDMLVQQATNEASRYGMAASNAATRRDSIVRSGVPQLDPTRSALLSLGGVAADLLNPGAGGSRQLAAAGQQAYQRNAAAYEDRLGGATSDLAYLRGQAGGADERARMALQASFGRDAQLASGGLQRIQGKADQAVAKREALAAEQRKFAHELALQQLENDGRLRGAGGGARDAALGIIGQMPDPMAQLRLYAMAKKADTLRGRAEKIGDKKQYEEAMDYADAVDDAILQFVQNSFTTGKDGQPTFRQTDYTDLDLLNRAIELRGDKKSMQQAFNELSRDRLVRGMSDGPDRIRRALSGLYGDTELDTTPPGTGALWDSLLGLSGTSQYSLPRGRGNSQSVWPWPVRPVY